MIKIRPVICLETGEKIDSFNECARSIGVPRSTLYNAVTKGHATRGHHYFYADKMQPPEGFFDHPHGKARVRVRCIETGEVFESTRKAMEKTGIDRREIYRAINNRAGGFHWEAVDD